MATSLNGWPVIYPGGAGLVTREIPGTGVRVTVAHDVAPVLLYVAARVHNEVRSISANNAKGGQDDGGYNFRPARNAGAFSNHASGTAVDLNWRIWPQNDNHKSMTKAETAAALRIYEDCKDVIFWGGLWERETDEMHWEIRPGTSQAEIDAFCKKHRIQPDGTVKPRRLRLPGVKR